MSNFIEVEVNGEILEFPSTMSKAEIKTAVDKKYGVAEKAPINKAEEPEENWFKDTVNMSRMLIDGFTMGAQADAVGAISGFAGFITGKNESIAEGYKKARQMFLDENKAIRDEYGASATAAEIAGAVATPIKAAQTLKGAVATGTGLAAFTGFMTADNDERLSAAQEGGLVGAGVSLVTQGLTKGVGKLWNTATRRNIEEELLKPDGSFKPITLADEGKDSAVKSVYRDLFSKSFLGGRKFRESEKTYVNAQQEVVDLAKQSYDDAVENAKKQFKIDSLEGDLEFKTFKEQQRNLVNNLKKEKRGVIDDLNVQKGKIEATVERAKIAKIDDAVTELDRSFRRRAFVEAMPSSVNEKQIDNVIISDDLTASMARLDEVWKDAFGYLKNKSFRFKQDEVAEKMLESLEGDVGVLFKKAEAEKMTKEILADMVANKTRSGQLSGEIISNMRASLGRAAGQQPDTAEGMLKARLYKSLQGIIDTDIVIPRLTSGKNKKELEQFIADKKAYGTLSVLRDAVKTAARDANKQGAFTANDWLGAVTRNSGYQARQGKGPLQSEAGRWFQAAKSRDDKINKAAVRLQRMQINNAKKDAEARIARIEKKISDSGDVVVDQGQGMLTGRIQQITEGTDTNVAELKGALQVEKAKLKSIQEAAGGAKDPTFLTQLAANAVLAAPAVAAGASGLAPAALVGAGTGAALLSQTGQRIAAGQTGVQQGLFGFGQTVGDPLQQAIQKAAAYQSGSQQ
jgi:hypothetical protein